MQTIGRYQLLDVLGQGGMAVVYRAYDTELEREVALKLLAAHLITESAFYQRFKREARIIATLEHPSIVPVYDSGIDDNRQPYLVMRLLRGGTLRERRERGELSGAALWPVMRQVAAALDYGHGRNIVHRDIKPVNILFDEKGNAYVSDFGIAKVRDATTTELTGNNVLGTPAYMSPEQFEGGAVDGRCDQYSLAVVLFEALAGQLPFGGRTPNVLMNQHLNDAPAAAHALNPALPPAVSAVLARALSKDPAARYPDVSTFVHELEAASYQPVPSSGMGPRATVEQQQIEGYYRAGLEAFQRSDWSATVAFLGRVLAIDPGYRDASRLRQTALLRLQERRNLPTPLPAPRQEPAIVQPGAGGTQPVAPPARPRNWRPWIVLGIGGLLLAVLLAYGFWPPPDVTITPTPTEDMLTATASPEVTLPPVSGQVQVVAAGGGRWQAGRESGSLSAGTPIGVPQDQRLRIDSEDDVTQLILPDGSIVFLDAETEISIAGAATGAAAFRLESGRVLVSGDPRVIVDSRFGAQASLDLTGLLGVSLSPSLLFEVACLAGQCSLRGENDDEAKWVALPAGKGGIVGNSGRAGPPENADYADYMHLAPDLVPTPTATATRTPTATATATPTRRIYPTATPTVATIVAPSSTPVPPPPPEDTSTPRPAAPTETPTEEPPTPVPTEGPTAYPTTDF